MKKFGDNIDLKGIVIHQVKKEAGTRSTSIKQAATLLPITEKERQFIGKIFYTYYKKSGPVYGIFANENPNFKETLRSYLSDSNFYNFTGDALSIYDNVLKGTVAATGGFLIFAHFFHTDKDCDYMLVMTITNKDGYMVSEERLTIEDIKNIDLSKVDVACMINLSKWTEIESGVDSDIKTYLSFVKGNKDVSYYFMSYIDCDNKTTSAESTSRLINAMEDYAKEKEYDRDDWIIKRNEIYGYCEGCMNEKREIQLSAISVLFDSDNPFDFEKFASDERYSVSPIISGDRSKLKKIKFVIYKDKRFSIEFDQDLLDKQIFYNKTKNELTIKRLPENLTNQIPVNAKKGN